MVKRNVLPQKAEEDWCFCGHARVDHNLSYEDCAVDGCDCSRFTWTNKKPSENKGQDKK